eukprot:COSAG02_NODE_61884_length_267_cov_0.898810_1_plen_30_part_01
MTHLARAAEVADCMYVISKFAKECTTSYSI